MRIEREWIEELVFAGAPSRRFTQDSPVLPDVWIRYGEKLSSGEDAPLDLLLTPYADSTMGERSFSPVGELYAAVRGRLETERRERGAWRRLREPGGYLERVLDAAGRDAAGGDAANADDEAPDERDTVEPEPAELAYNQSTVAVRLYFDEVVRVLLPLTEWWRRNVCRDPGRATLSDLSTAGGRETIEADLERIEAGQGEVGGPVDLLWLVQLVGGILAAARAKSPGDSPDQRHATWRRILEEKELLVREFRGLVLEPWGSKSDALRPCPSPLLYLVSRNREARPTISYSVQAVKADAARRVFRADCSGLAWAILDSGIDAEHPAFRRRDDDGRPHPEPFAARRPHNRTRVEATFDFTRIRLLLSGSIRQLREEAERLGRRADEISKELEDLHERLHAEDDAVRREALASRATRLKRARAGLEGRRKQWEAFAAEAAEDAPRLKKSLLAGRAVDWERLRGVLEVRHEDRAYVPPVHEHGTHVAGILAADWRREHWEPRDGEDAPPERPSADLVGVCPDIRLYDFRVFDDEGNGDEFSVMAALQFLRHLNAHQELPLVHGANLSLAIRHDVANYACGRTPVCDECERVVAAGIVVVAAAGNFGYHRFSTLTDAGAASRYEGYSAISIADPGNADGVITVGSTHRIEPHTYGVSYFSSRGPTGDGRYKPDLVAPGEKITAPVPGNGSRVKDGTSMAAPHVSGAAALILARHREFVRQPTRIKQILCETATDLGRDRYFQGSGMVDVLRALQSV